MAEYEYITKREGARGTSLIRGWFCCQELSLLGSMEPPTGGIESILSIRLATAAGFVHIFSIYAPTLGASEYIKDHFYDELDSLIGKIPKVEPLIFLCDFNARVGSDHQSWPSCIGHHGTGRMDDSGQRLLELCSFHGLCITKTFFQSKHQHKVSWKHPRSHKWHQLDLVIARRSRTADPQRSEQFVASLEQSLQDLPDQDATARWNTLSNTIYDAAITAFGKRDIPRLVQC